MEVEVVKCPNCGANLSIEDIKCKYCNSFVYIKKYRDVSSLSMDLTNKMITFYKQNLQNNNLRAVNDYSLALCYLQIKQYDIALSYFNQAISKDLSNPYFFYYKAICLFKGKRPFCVNRSIINEAEACIETALSMQNLSDFYYLWAIIRYDYYKRKCFNIHPDYKELLYNAKKQGINQNHDEISALFHCDFDKIFNTLEEVD